MVAVPVPATRTSGASATNSATCRRMSSAVVGWYWHRDHVRERLSVSSISLSQKSIPLCDRTRCLAGAFDNLLWAVPAMTMTLTKINRNSVSLAGEFAALSQLALRGYDANMTLGRTKSVDILVSNPAPLPSGAMAARNRARRIPHYARSNPRLARLRTINTPNGHGKKQCPGHVVSPKR